MLIYYVKIYMLLRKTRSISDANKEVGLEANAEKTAFVFLSAARKNRKVSKYILRKCGEVQMFANDDNKSKLNLH
jgi:hypothetical protein